jgi:hypothetical protein
MYPYLKLAWSLYRHLKNNENRRELMDSLTGAVNNDHQITVGEWARIGSALGVFKSAR